MRKGVYDTTSGELKIVYGDSVPVPAQQSMTGLQVVDVPDAYPDTVRWDSPTRSFIADLAVLKAATIKRLKDEAELLKMQSMTPGGAKKEEYAANKAEVRDADQLGGALLTAIASLKLVTGGLEARFPQATANAAEFGDTVPDALNRFRKGIAGAAPCPKISAREAKVCADIRAATTRAAFDAILTKHKWPA